MKFARIFLIISATVLSNCAPIQPEMVNVASHNQSLGLDALADAYVKLSLEIGTQEEGYIDAYYGPESWQPQNGAPQRPRSELTSSVRSLAARVAKYPATDGNDIRRVRFLIGQLRAAETRLMMAEGTHFGFVDEAERLFGVRPTLKPLQSFDADLVALEMLIPGDGPLADRVDAAQDATLIPADRLKPVFDIAIAECRKRTLAYIPLPQDENFVMEFVTGKSWSGYNYYQGGYKSLIQINTDLPIRLSRAVDLGCHEGYPGHHALNMLLEQKLSRGRGWREFTVYPLYSPQSLIAEGSANFGIELAFPGDTKMAFERDILATIAGIEPTLVERNAKLLKRLVALSGARLTIAQQYLDGAITREQAIALSQKYLLLSRERAEQSIRFTEQYRSYVINYGLGQDMVRDFVLARGADDKARWQRMENIISEPTLPSDLVVDKKRP